MAHEDDQLRGMANEIAMTEPGIIMEGHGNVFELKTQQGLV